MPAQLAGNGHGEYHTAVARRAKGFWFWSPVKASQQWQAAMLKGPEQARSIRVDHIPAGSRTAVPDTMANRLAYKISALPDSGE
ncbi:hypothetical protein VI06_16505 [Aquitalea magnusonii]|nr:hypothetical protein VI06_16505 [Aquitalea magnusonii]